MTTASSAVHAESTSAVRWGLLAICVVCMIMIANLQYGWTLFVNPMKEANPTWGFDFLWWHWDTLSAITLAFTIFIALETWLTPIQGWFVDVLGPQRGPKVMVALGGILVGLGWVINSIADSLTLLYLGAVVGGAG